MADVTSQSHAAHEAPALPFHHHPHHDPYHDWIKQMRKLRWIGMEEEAQRLPNPSRRRNGSREH